MIVINGKDYTAKMIAEMTDHSVLNVNVTKNDIIEAAAFCKEWNCRGLHANPGWASLIIEEFQGYDIECGYPTAFPLGCIPTEMKVKEVENAVEIFGGRPGCCDIVINVGKLIDGEYDYVRNELAQCVEVGHAGGIQVKSILEVAQYDLDLLKIATQLACEAGVDLVKTATGRGGKAEIKHVKVMSAIAAPMGVGVKYSGFSEHNPAEAAVLAIAAGATRLGTRRTAQIIEGLKKYENLEITMK
jgi:deoxyribose-phosphate aldolase